MIRRRFSPAFTLIELLVVVAIIAILAAIAVPNFLEAQTRSKVVRVKADMRTISVGLESYRVDTNRYPPDSSDGVVVYIQRLRRLTTPVSYLTSIPADPFANIGKIKDYVAIKGYNPYADPITSNNWVYPFTYDFACRINPNGTMESDAMWRKIALNPDQILWGMRGVGPDLWPAWLGDPEAAYDPTNGTTSKGNIYWTGPGKGEDMPRES